MELVIFKMAILPHPFKTIVHPALRFHAFGLLLAVTDETGLGVARTRTCFGSQRWSCCCAKTPSGALLLLLVALLNASAITRIEVGGDADHSQT